MSTISHTLRASTLVETLVMMLVAGIVFLSVMDGLRLFTALQTRRIVELSQAGRQAAGYYRIESLVAGADSIGGIAGRLELFRGDVCMVLELSDSALIYKSEFFCDTLMTSIGEIRFADSVQVGMSGFMARFPVRPPRSRGYDDLLFEIEKDYGYEE